MRAVFISRFLAKPALLALALLALAACGNRQDDAVADGESRLNAISYDDYNKVLREFVDGAGLVDYKGLLRVREPLDAFVADLGRVDPAAFAQWTREERLAFWINAYNAITLVHILEHYPIDRGGIVASILHPRNSIRQIDGVWTKLTAPVLGEAMTLDHIEHDILRKEFDEPRIHAAIVCAARSCPPLRAEAFWPHTLDAQLDDQGRRFLGAEHRFRIDRDKNTVYISPILKWFAEDFVKAYGNLGRIAQLDENDSAAMRYAMRYMNDADSDYLASGAYRVVYLDYDWSLNEQD